MKVTRGYGILEVFLAKKRSRMAEKLIPDRLREGSILDIGCGLYPFFLLNTVFFEKHGLDKVHENREYDQRLKVSNYDIETGCNIPYEDNIFSVITMLAVVEHIESHKIAKVFSEVHRIMKPGGVFIITTPAAWTDSLLRMMAKLRILSAEEINEHKDTYTHGKIRSLFQEGGFNKEDMLFGYFEIFMNLWATAAKR
jgi:SAM-dependent methyltransferase